MKTEANELCSSCREIPWGNGMTLGEMIDVLNNDVRFKDKSDDDISAMIFSTLYSHRAIRHCTRCWQLILDRIPSWMKGPR